MATNAGKVIRALVGHVKKLSRRVSALEKKIKSANPPKPPKDESLGEDDFSDLDMEDGEEDGEGNNDDGGI